MADLQSLRILTQISAGKCTNFGIVSLIHLSVDKLVFNLDDLVFLALTVILTIFDTVVADSAQHAQYGTAEERRSYPMLEVRIQLLRSTQQNLPCEADRWHYLPWLSHSHVHV